MLQHMSQSVSARRQPNPMDYSRECGMYRYEIDAEIRDNAPVITGVEINLDAALDAAFDKYMSRECNGIAAEEIF
jgi:hypothetical protein